MKGFETGIEKCARIYTQDTGVRVIWGDKCMTDGKGTIWLPTLSDNTNPKVLTRTRLNMGHEISHVLHSDFEAVARAIKTGGASKRNILNSLEDVRIERLWELEYTGCQEDFREDFKDFVRKDFNFRLLGPEPILSKVMNILYLRAREVQLGFNSGLVVPELIEALFQDKVGDLVEKVASQTTMKQVEEYTDLIYKRFKEGAPPPEPKPGAPPPEPKPEPKPEKSEGKKSDEKKSDGEKSDGEKSKDGESKGDKSEKSKGEKSDEKESDGEESEGGESEEDKSEKDESEDDESSGDDSEGSEKDKSSDDEEDESEDGESSGDDSEESEDDESDKEDGESSGGDGESSEDDEEDESDPSTSPRGISKDSSSESEGDESDDESDGPGGEPSELDNLKEDLKDDLERKTDISTIQDFRSKMITDFAMTSDQYLVDPGVLDHITKPSSGASHHDQAVLHMAEGKKILSFLGQRLQHLFVSKQSRRVMRFLKTGPLDSYRIMEDESDLICKKKLRGRAQDAVVGFSIDKSSSMYSDGKDTLATQMSLATGFFLEQIKVPFMALGLTGPSQYKNTRTRPVDIYILKEFNESIRKVMGRFVSVHMDQNSDLDGLKVLAQQILMRPEPKKIIFVFSDGQPCSGNSELDAKHMRSYKEYIKRLQKAGIIVFGFGMEYDVEHIFGKEFSVTVQRRNIREFPMIVFQKLSKILLE